MPDQDSNTTAWQIGQQNADWLDRATLNAPFDSMEEKFVKWSPDVLTNDPTFLCNSHNEMLDKFKGCCDRLSQDPFWLPEELPETVALMSRLTEDLNQDPANNLATNEQRASMFHRMLEVRCRLRLLAGTIRSRINICSLWADEEDLFDDLREKARSTREGPNGTHLFHVSAILSLMKAFPGSLRLKEAQRTETLTRALEAFAAPYSQLTKTFGMDTGLLSPDQAVADQGNQNLRDRLEKYEKASGTLANMMKDLGS